MDDVRSFVRQIERAPAPDLWPDVRERTPGAPTPEPGPRHRWGITAMALLVAIAAFAFVNDALRLGGTPGDEGPSPSETPPALTGDPRITATVPLPAGTTGGGVTIGAGSAWIGLIPSGGDGGYSVLRIDLETNEIVAQIPVRGAPWRERIAATEDAVWVGSSGLVERIDPATNTVIARVEIPGRFVSALTADRTAVWVVAIRDRSDEGLQNVGTLLRIEPTTDAIVAETPLGVRVTGYDDQVRIGRGSVWVLGSRLVDEDTEDGGDLIRVDLATNDVVALIPVDGFDMVVAQDAVWARSPVDGLFDGSDERWHWVLVDFETNGVSDPLRFDDPGLELVTADALWSVGYDEEQRVRVTRSDPGTLEEEARSTPVGSLFHDAGLDPATGTLWVSAISDIVRVDIA